MWTNERKVTLSVSEMWKGMLLIKVVLIIVGFVVFSFGNTIIWIALGALTLLGGAWMMFRQGQGAGHEACSVSHSVERVISEGKEGEVTQKLRSQMWSRSNGAKSVLASALIPYVINAIYIIFMLLDVNFTATIVARLVSWAITMPFWPIVAYWHETFTVLTPDIVAVLMISPFVLPLCHFAGYMTGPKLWEKTEKAMADGRRRAKARSRIVKKKKGGPQKPLI